MKYTRPAVISRVNVRDLESRLDGQDEKVNRLVFQLYLSSDQIGDNIVSAYVPSLTIPMFERYIIQPTT